MLTGFITISSRIIVENSRMLSLLFVIYQTHIFINNHSSKPFTPGKENGCQGAKGSLLSVSRLTSQPTCRWSTPSSKGLPHPILAPQLPPSGSACTQASPPLSPEPGLLVPPRPGLGCSPPFTPRCWSRCGSPAWGWAGGQLDIWHPLPTVAAEWTPLPATHLSAG